MINENAFFNKYKRDPVALSADNLVDGEPYGLVHKTKPKVQYIINKYERNPAAADIDDDNEIDDNAPNVQYIIEQPGETSYNEVLFYRRTRFRHSFGKAIIVTDKDSNEIVLIPDPVDPTQSTDGYTLHPPNPTFWDERTANSTTPAIAPVPSVEPVKDVTLPPIPVAKAAAPVSSALMAKVLFTFAGTGTNQMPLTAGETVEVVQRGKPGAWSKGLRGSFPTDYVQFIESADSTAVVAPKKGGRSKTRRKGGRRSTTTRKSKRGGAKSKKETEICPICFEELKKGEQIPKLNCKHKFHKACLALVCRQKGNKNVPCPLCRGDISFSCVADITRASPWKYDPYTSGTPYDRTQMANMSHEERRQMGKEIQKHHRNWLARRRRTIRRETPQQRELRIENESRRDAEIRAENDRYFRNPRVENEPFIPSSPDSLPRSPAYYPSTPPDFLPHTPPTPRYPAYYPSSPDYPPPTQRSPTSP